MIAACGRDVARSKAFPVPCGSGQDLTTFSNTIVRLEQGVQAERASINGLNGVCLCATLLT